MKTSDFYYDLPKELIAQTPVERVTTQGCCCLTEKTENYLTSTFVTSQTV